MPRKGNIYNKDNTSNENINDLKEKVEKQQVISVDVAEDVVSSEVSDNNDPKEIKPKQTKQIVLLIIFIIIAISLTGLLLVLKYNNLNKVDNITNDTSTNINYGITDYKEMYYINPLTFKEEQYYKERNDGEYRTEINYVTVSGLKDKALQDRINKEIKDTAYKYYNYIGPKEDYLVYTNIGANFSNILSINISLLMWDNVNEKYRVDEEVGLNYNLLTGEKLTFTDVFAPNTPMNYIISEMAYNNLAWDTEINFDSDEEDWDKNMNMDNRDTSEYEDIILKNILDFNNVKNENREFFITSSRIHVKMRLGNDENAYFAGIPSYKYGEYICIYKKFLADETKLKEVYENMPTKKKLVFSDEIGIEQEFADHIYDNLYFSLTILDYVTDDEDAEVKYPESTIILKDELIEKNFVDIMNRVKSLARDNKKYGYISRAIIDTYIDTYKNDFGKEDYIHIYVESVIDRSDIQYYNTYAFKSYAARILSPKVDVWGAILGQIEDKNITRLEKETISYEYFYDLNGKLIAKNSDELEKYMDDKYKEEVIEQPSDGQIDIYNE